MKVNVLGTEYAIKGANEHTDPYLAEMDGYCDTSTKECVIDEMDETAPGAKRNLPEYKKKVTRHELIHAFLHESGLAENCDLSKPNVCNRGDLIVPTT